MPTTSVMDTPVPPVGLVAWCNTCQRYVSDGAAGQRCPIGDPVCYSILVGRRAMSLPPGQLPREGPGCPGAGERVGKGPLADPPHGRA